MRFKVAGLLAAGFTLGVVQGASAADMAVKASPMAAPPAFSWTGFSIGVDVGGITSRTAINVPSIVGIFTANPNPSGFIWGGHINYRYQLSNNVVLGAEADVWGVSASTAIATYVGPAPTVGRAQFNVRSGESLRGQLGYAVDRVLFYGTGGLSIVNATGCNDVPGIACIAGSALDKKGQAGWTAGGGLEYAVTNNWTVRGEYLYANYGSYTTPTTFGLGTNSTNLTTNVFRGGISYKF